MLSDSWKENCINSLCTESDYKQNNIVKLYIIMDKKINITIKLIVSASFQCIIEIIHWF